MWRGQSVRGGERKRSRGLVGASEIIVELAEWCRLRQRNANTLGLPNRKARPHHHKVNSWQRRRSFLCLKEKGRRLSNYQIVRWERVKVSKNGIWARKMKIRARSWIERVDCALMEGEFLGVKGGQVKRPSLVEKGKSSGG